MSGRKLAFVTPRFSEKIAGGAETLVAKFAQHLAAAGDDITILTTCAIDNRTWENHFPEGETRELGLRVLRFQVDNRNIEKWLPLQIAVCEGAKLTIEQQLDWMQESVNSSALYSYILDNSDKYECIFFAPYLFGTTFWGSLINPEKSILIPCLHDESYAYTEVMSSMFRQVKGFLFNALAEKHLAESLYGPLSGGEVGMGFDPLPGNLDLSPYFKEKFTYILYLGRKETGKNLHLLIDYFIKFKEAGRYPDLKLVIAGGGSFSDVGSEELLKRGDIVDLLQVSEADKKKLINNADFLCQPSTNESFSIVLMEAWQLGVPVLVHADCAVTKSHVIESGGGLYFGNFSEFSAVLAELLSDSKLKASLGDSGKLYVAEKYSWPAVIDRFNKVFQAIG